MMTAKTAAAFIIFFTGILFLKGQDIEFTEIKFQYLQYPLLHAGKGIHNYNSHIILKYLDEGSGAKLGMEERKKKAEADYKKEMEEYTKLNAAAEKEYTERMAVWNSKTVSEKMTGEKPKKKIVPLPYKRMPVEEKYRKKFDTVTLAEKFLKLEGFSKSSENALIIKVFMLGFECSEPKLFEKEHTKLSGNHQTEKYIKYRYAIKYRHPAGFRIEKPDGTILMEEYPTEFSEFVEMGTPEFENKETLEKLWQEKKEEFLNIVQQEIVEKNLKAIGEKINQLYGFRTIEYTTQVGFVDEKSNYFDLKAAYGAVTIGYNSFKTDLSKGEAREHLKKAIDAWENAYKESDTENKKARIDKGVTEMILVNLAEACMWMDDYGKAQVYLNKLLTMEADKKNIERAEKIKAMIPVLKERFEANQ